MDFSYIDFKTVLVREPIAFNSDEWQKNAHQWVVIINQETFDYYTGLAHRKAKAGCDSEYKYLSNLPFGKKLTQAGFEKMIQISKPTPPKIEDVLYSLIGDSDASEMTFSEWCANYGCDDDSRKMLDVYLKCQDNAKKLNKALTITPEMRDFFAEY